MHDSILKSIKKLLNIADDDCSFDTDVIIHINSVLATCCQVGIGKSDGYFITGETECWIDFLGDKIAKQQMVLSYIYLKVKLLFDPPSSSSVMEAINNSIKEFEWRLSISTD